MIFFLSAIAPGINVEAANNARTDTDTGYLSEKWHTGLGTGIGALNSIKSADIDNDGEDELIFGNSQGYVHVLDWDASNDGWHETFQTVDMGGPVKGMEIAQIDDDEQLEIAIGYNWNADSGKVKIIDGISLLAETNWSSGVSWSHTQWTEGWPYGLAMGDLDGDEKAELAMSGDRGFLWVVDTDKPEIYVGRDITYDEAEWYVDVGAQTGGSTLENTWGLTFGQFDEDEATEVAVGSKQGWIAVFDGETEELQWKYDMDGSSGADSLCYSLISADLDGDDIDELVVPQQNKLTIFMDGDRDVRIEDTSVKSGYGLANQNLFGNDNEELVVADGSGKIRIMGLDGSSLTTYQEWSGGYPMNTGGGVTVSMNGHDNPWVVHGGDAGVVRAWEITSQNTHELAWTSEAGENDNLLHSLEGGKNYGVAMGNLDDDDNLEIVVGSGSGRVYVFDGNTHETQWVSPVLDKLPIGVAIGDLNNNGDNEIAITTGLPAEPKGEDGNGGEGYFYVFEKDGNDFTQAFKSDDIDAAYGLTISELDGSTYPEIGIGTGYLEIISATAGTTELHGAVKIWGYGGSSYSQEWTSGNIGQIVGGIGSGDPDDDGDNELVIGTGGDERESSEENAEVRVYHRVGGSYSLDGSVINPGRFKAYGIAVGDVNDDGQDEIIVGTGEKGENKPKLAIYDGSTHAEEYSKSVDSNSVWGVATGDFDSDGEPELIYGTSGGELFVYDGVEPSSFEAKTSALSGNAGHYGGIAIGNVDNEGAMEMAVGSEAYLWLFTTEGQTNKPDLAIEGSEITYLPENPDEDEDIVINMSIVNYGGADTTKWRVKVYDGDPDAGGKKITEFSCDATEEDQREGCKALSSGESAFFEVTWYGIQTTPGYHEIYGLAEDTNQPRQETRFSNNKDFTTIEIEEIPNDKPVISASIDKTILWVDESARIDAGNSYDNETTDGDLDRADGEADLTYRYYFDDGWTSWVGDYTWDVSFSTPGDKEVIVMTRDERRKESDEKTIAIEVKANTQPVAVLVANITEVLEDNFITFDVSESYDPDARADLEYRFSFGDNVYSDWVKEGQTVRLYRNAFFTGSNGGELQQDSGEEVLRDNFGIIRVFRLMNGSNPSIAGLGLSDGLYLLEVINSQVTSNGYNYSLPKNTVNDNSDFAEQKIYSAQLMARELSESGADDVLASSWSSSLAITVIKPENLEPVAMAQAGIFINGESSIWSDIIKNAKTGDEITYSGANSYDPDGEIVEYSWRMLDSQGLAINLLGDKNEKSFKKIYNEPGTYTSILTVTDNRGAEDTWQVTVTVSKSGNYDEETDEEGYNNTMLLGIAGAIAIVGIAAGLLSNKLGVFGGEGEEDIFEDFTPGPLELNCPTCNGLISITTAQRPIQVGCPMCQSQFVIRE
ncbi:MAG: hypothetical protein BEU04_04910 [Marine Group III euryarchaeote CG-Bathy1]|uniref:PKD domain-containing protein n=1 Tax=Marine Group III euryarchaeote CG-Bathy1 TaxID=1889001 RepID=A0A1J5TWU3_9ARCH|nr:MAG: hypothetical protein BEU04_04910 [Marine Group III euryarchaeote CG-Bathy1]